MYRIRELFNILQDEEFNRHETFERQFNFRFEEPDHELVSVFFSTQPITGA